MADTCVAPRRTRRQSDAPTDRSTVAIIGLIAVAAFAIRIAVAFLLPAIHHADEIFQVLEPAHRMAFGTGVVTWEWRLGIRSWFLPSAFALVMRLTEGLGPGSSGYLAAIAVMMTLLSLSVVIVGGSLGARLKGPVGAIITAGLCAIWYELVYYAPSTLADAIAGHIMVLAAYVGWIAGDAASHRRHALLGLLLGLVFCIRFQLAPALAFAAIYVCRLDLRRRWLPLLAGAAIPLAALAIVDTITLGLPLQSIWRNLWVNLIEERSVLYGSGVWYYYLLRFVEVSPFAAVAVLYLTIVYARRFPLFVGMIVAQVIAYSAIPHKEMRLLYPVMPLAIIVAGLGTTELLAPLMPQSSSRRRCAVVGGVALLFWCGLSYSAAVGNSFRARWGDRGELLSVMEDLGSRPDFCGLGIMGPEWYLYGGYAHLHRASQISLIMSSSEIAQAAPSFNYAIVLDQAGPQLTGFHPVHCWSADTGDHGSSPPPVRCLLQRPGSCTANPHYEFSTVLARFGY